MRDNEIAELACLDSRPKGLERVKIRPGISCRSLRNDKL